MDPAFLSRVAHAVDRSRRLPISCRVEQQIADGPRGARCREPRSDGGEYPASSPNRVHWFTAESPLNQAELERTLAAVSARSLPRIYFMINPRAWSEDLEQRLNAAGVS